MKIIPTHVPRKISHKNLRCLRYFIHDGIRSNLLFHYPVWPDILSFSCWEALPLVQRFVNREESDPTEVRDEAKRVLCSKRKRH